ncbi:MAG: polysaccharide pyruvyl transferase family protein [Micrococcus sp.]|nr:polysaccharide pyruvyl transferase family protein [Micrococcus sp.]
MLDDAVRRAQGRLRRRPIPASSTRRVMLVHHSGTADAANTRELATELRRLRHQVFGLDVRRHPDLLVTLDDAGPVLDLSGVSTALERFRPHVILVDHPSWRLHPQTVRRCRDEGIHVIQRAESAESGDKAGWWRTVSRGELLSSPTAWHSPALVAGYPSGDGERGGGEPAGPAERVDRLAEGALLEDVLAEKIAALPPVHEAVASRAGALVISGYYGAGNRGDELLLATLVEKWQRSQSPWQVIVGASKPAVVERQHGVQAFARPDLAAAEQTAAHTAALLLGPGGHWHDHSIHLAPGTRGMVNGARVSPGHMAQLPLLVSAYGGQVHVVGMGVGPLDDPAARAAVRLTGQVAARVTVRDAASLALLEGVSEHWSAPVQVVPDLVFGLPLPTPRSTAERDEGTAPVMVVNLRPWHDDSADRAALIDALVTAAQQHGLRIVGVPFQHSDVAPLTDLADVARDRVEMEILDPDLDLQDLAQVLSDAHVMVAMRLHASLLRHRLRGRVVGLSYDPKVRAHFEELGCADDVVDLDGDPNTVSALLKEHISAPELPARVVERIAQAEQAAEAYLDDLFARINAAPDRPLDPAWVFHTGQTPTPTAPAPSAPTAPVTAPASAVAAPEHGGTASAVASGPQRVAQRARRAVAWRWKRWQGRRRRTAG